MAGKERQRRGERYNGHERKADLREREQNILQDQ
jgi:hypothetical protein